MRGVGSLPQHALRSGVLLSADDGREEWQGWFRRGYTFCLYPLVRSQGSGKVCLHR